MIVRREVLGDAHVDAANARITPETADFQEFITRYAWGEVWSRPGLVPARPKPHHPRESRHGRPRERDRDARAGGASRTASRARRSARSSCTPRSTRDFPRPTPPSRSRARSSRSSMTTEPGWDPRRDMDKTYAIGGGSRRRYRGRRLDGGRRIRPGRRSDRADPCDPRAGHDQSARSSRTTAASTAGVSVSCSRRAASAGSSRRTSARTRTSRAAIWVVSSRSS